MRDPTCRIAAFALALAACGAHPQAAGARRPDGFAEAGADPGGDPLAVARAFYSALHRADARAAGTLVAGPDAGPALVALVTLARAYQSLEGAIRERFGAGAAREVGYSDRVAAEDAALAAARADVQGDRAVVRAGEETLATLARVRGRWRVQLEDALTSDEGVAALVREAESSRDSAARVTPAIRGGLFDSAADALEAFKNGVALGMQGAAPELPRAAPGERPRAPEPQGVPL
jgi:hypothetical protein